MVSSKVQRPRHGVEMRKGWSSAPGDLPCGFCGQEAMLLDPSGTPAHPTCVDMNRERQRNERHG